MSIPGPGHYAWRPDKRPATIHLQAPGRVGLTLCGRPWIGCGYRVLLRVAPTDGHATCRTCEKRSNP